MPRLKRKSTDQRQKQIKELVSKRRREETSSANKSSESDMIPVTADIFPTKILNQSSSETSTSYKTTTKNKSNENSLIAFTTDKTATNKSSESATKTSNRGKTRTSKSNEIAPKTLPNGKTTRKLSESSTKTSTSEKTTSKPTESPSKILITSTNKLSQKEETPVTSSYLTNTFSVSSNVSAKNCCLNVTTISNIRAASTKNLSRASKTKVNTSEGPRNSSKYKETSVTEDKSSKTNSCCTSTKETRNMLSTGANSFPENGTNVSSISSNTSSRTVSSSSSIVNNKNESFTPVKRYFEDQTDKQNKRRKELEEKRNSSNLPEQANNLKPAANRLRQQKLRALKTPDKKNDGT